MTNKIEQEFYKCFEIEPKYIDACTVEDKYWDNEELANEYGTFDMYMNARCGNQEECSTLCSCAYTKEVYPPITDRILLELICILSETGTLEFNGVCSVEEIKEELLKTLIEYEKDTGKIKHKIQQLFKEYE